MKNIFRNSQCKFPPILKTRIVTPLIEECHVTLKTTLMMSNKWNSFWFPINENKKSSYTKKLAPNSILCGGRLIINSEALRPGHCKYRELIFKTEITDFYILCQEKPSGKLFSKIRLKLSREFLILRNPTKSRIAVFLPRPP